MLDIIFYTLYSTLFLHQTATALVVMPFSLVRMKRLFASLSTAFIVVVNLEVNNMNVPHKGSSLFLSVQ